MRHAQNYWEKATFTRCHDLSPMYQNTCFTSVPGMDRAQQCLGVVPRFEWEPRKAASNRTKHKVSFEEAATAFEDERAQVIDDPEHSKSEDRFFLLGMSRLPRVLVVVHCFRELHLKI